MTICNERYAAGKIGTPARNVGANIKALAREQVSRWIVATLPTLRHDLAQCKERKIGIAFDEHTCGSNRYVKNSEMLTTTLQMPYTDPQQCSFPILEDIRNISIQHLMGL